MRPCVFHRLYIFVLATIVASIVLCFIVVERNREHEYWETRDFCLVAHSVLRQARDTRLPGNTVYTDGDLPLYSWRFETHLVTDPVHDLSGLPEAAGFPWDSANQKQISQSGYGRFFRNGNSRFATIFALEGNGCAFVPRQRWADGGFERRRKVEDLPKCLIFIVQVRQRVIEWNQPGDCRISDLLQAKEGMTIGSNPMFQGPILVGFVDGTVWRLRASLPVSLLAKFGTIEGAKGSDRNAEIGPYVITRVSTNNTGEDDAQASGK